MLKDKFLHPTTHDGIANKYVIRCMHITMLIVLVVWFLNMIDVFIVSKTVMSTSVAISMGLYVVGLVCFGIFGIDRSIMKYFVITWTISITSVLATGLTFHALLATVIPIMFCSLYYSRRIIVFTMILMILSNIVIVFGGYHVGLCDANMTLLTGEPLSYYINENGEFSTTKINDDIIMTLSLFFVLPRTMIYFACMLVSFNIAKIIRNSTERAKRMQRLAECDGMTGLYNKSKYMRILGSNESPKQKIAVIYWDVNGLKALNDSRGHEYGDALIRVVAESILTVTPKNAMSFRIGGDEFIMIMETGDVNKVEELISNWKKVLWDLSRNFAFDVNASVGYSIGVRRNLKELVNEADKMMYESKKKFYEEG